MAKNFLKLKKESKIKPKLWWDLGQDDQVTADVLETLHEDLCDLHLKFFTPRSVAVSPVLTDSWWQRLPLTHQNSLDSSLSALMTLCPCPGPPREDAALVRIFWPPLALAVFLSKATFLNVQCSLLYFHININGILSVKIPSIWAYNFPRVRIY